MMSSYCHIAAGKFIRLVHARMQIDRLQRVFIIGRRFMNFLIVQLKANDDAFFVMVVPYSK